MECYSGHTYAQEPRAVVWQGRRFPVAGIERRWRTPEGPAFRVETEQGIPFELHYSEREKVWAIEPMAELEFGGRDRGRQEGENAPRITVTSHGDNEDKEVREER